MSESGYASAGCRSTWASQQNGWLARFAALCLLLAGCLSISEAAPPAAPSAMPTIEVAPIPSWVAPTAAEAGSAPVPAPTQFALIDRQTRVGGDGVTRFERLVRDVHQAAGLETAAQIQIEFDPAYQRLVMHALHIQRGGQRIDKLDVHRIKLLQRESRLEARIYDGRLTASMVLDDVRVGDRIEWSFSLLGDNPVFEGKFVDVEWAAAVTAPVTLFQYRLLAPESRTLRHRVAGDGFEVSSRTSDGMRETRIQRRAVPQLVFDAYAPSASYVGDFVQVSEFADWADVARWADRQFALSVRPSDALRARAKELRASSAQETVRRALDFVQGEIRYFGTETGVSSHRPAAPDLVLAQRFGDCKDKVGLLAALLREAGIGVQPALVSTLYRDQAADLLPSPLAFDHVIARVTVGKEVLWLDATRSHQRGDLSTRQSVGLGDALIAAAGTTALTATPGTAGELRIVARDIIKAPKLSEDPVLEASHTYHGEIAESIRATLAGQSVAEFERQFVGDYVRYYPSLKQVGTLQVTEDPTRNALTVSVRFEMPGYWRFPELRSLNGEFVLFALMQPLQLPNQAPRKRPFRLFYPGIYRHVVEHAFSEAVFTRPLSSRAEDEGPHIAFHMRAEGAGDKHSIQGELQISAPAVAPAEWATHRERLVKLWPKLSGNVSIATVTNERIDKLERELKAMQDEIRAGKVKASTPVQERARYRVLTLTAQIDGGRLAPPLRAQALVERGVQLTYVAMIQEAIADLEAAVRLDPSNADAHAGLAVNALLASRDDKAIEAASKAVQLSPTTISARYTRAYANYYKRNYRDARQELQDILNSRAEVDRGYAALWLYIAARREGADGREAIKPYVSADRGQNWPHPVLQYFEGSIDIVRALAATSEDGKLNPGRLCELYFYAGQKLLLNGDVSGAQQYFRKSVETGVVEFNEYVLAKRELDRLAAR